MYPLWPKENIAQTLCGIGFFHLYCCTSGSQSLPSVMMLVGSVAELYPLGMSCSVLSTPFETSNKSWLSNPNHRNLCLTFYFFTKIPPRWCNITIDNTHQFILNWVWSVLTKTNVNMSWTFELHHISTVQKQAEYDKTVHALKKTHSSRAACMCHDNLVLLGREASLPLDGH